MIGLNSGYLLKSFILLLQFTLGAKFTPGDRRLNGTDIDDTTLIPFSGVGRPSVPQKPKGG